jgi:nucleotide-binding universal stress UspA family protein
MDQAESSPLGGQPDPRQRRVHGNEPLRPSGEPLRPSGADARLDHPVVVGYDGSPSSRNALAYAAGVSRRLSRPLVIVHVTPGVYCEPLTGQVIGAPRARAETEHWVRTELAEVCDCRGVDVQVIMRHGNAARELSTAAEELSADALVIGAPRQRWHQVAGSVPGWLARHARCPVIVVP